MGMFSMRSDPKLHIQKPRPARQRIDSRKGERERERIAD
jgi:hypothetical protein